MICARCGEPTEAQPCGSCGEDPTLDGRYRLDAIVGRGSSGVTWRATWMSAGREVAIKEILLRSGDAAKARELVEREVRVLRQLRHAAIPRYESHFELREGRHRALYLVQEFIEGETLAEELKARRYTEDEVLDVVDELLGALEYLHRLSPPVIHRDLKPGNVIRRSGGYQAGRLALIDFGAVRDTLTQPGSGGSTVAGTFGYMPPEQFVGDASPATDLYALGALAVALLTRRDPGALSDARNQIQWRPHAEVRPATAALIDGLIAPDLGARIKTAAEARRGLRAARRGADLPSAAPDDAAPEEGWFDAPAADAAPRQGPLDDADAQGPEPEPASVDGPASMERQEGGARARPAFMSFALITLSLFLFMCIGCASALFVINTQMTDEGAGASEVEQISLLTPEELERAAGASEGPDLDLSRFVGAPLSEQERQGFESLYSTELYACAREAGLDTAITLWAERDDGGAWAASPLALQVFEGDCRARVAELYTLLSAGQEGAELSLPAPALPWGDITEPIPLGPEDHPPLVRIEPTPAGPAGQCVAELVIDTQGIPRGISLPDCDSRLVVAGYQALSQWRFPSYVPGSVSQPVRLVTPVDFQ